MDLQSMFNNALAARRAERMKTSPQLTLGELLLKLEAVADKSKFVMFDDGTFHPSDLSSWRGDYSELALEYDGEVMTVDHLIKLLKEATGKEFGGYKGGDYTMGKTTAVWVANWGESSGFKDDDDNGRYYQGVVDVLEVDGFVSIITEAMGA